MDLYLFAILPFSLLWWPKQWRGIVGIIPLLAALVPAALSGLRALVDRRQAGNAASRAATQAQRADLSRQKQEFYDPTAVQRRESTRTRPTMQLGRLAGHFGGLDR